MFPYSNPPLIFIGRSNGGHQLTFSAGEALQTDLRNLPGSWTQRLEVGGGIRSDHLSGRVGFRSGHFGFQVKKC